MGTSITLIQPSVGTRLYGLPDFEANQPGFDRDGQSGGDHAGRVETSLLGALHPECVDLSRLPPENEPGSYFAMGANARESDRRTGERMVADEVRWLGAKAQELLATYEREKPPHTQRTFEQVEQLWESVLRPELPKFRSMQAVPEGQEPPPETSVWHRNRHIPKRT